MRFFHRPSWLGPTPANAPTPADQLRDDIAALERELASCKRTLADLEAEMRTIDDHAMEAIRSADDRAARAHFLEHRPRAEKVDALAADLKVLRAILDECYAFTDAMAVSPPPPP